MREFEAATVRRRDEAVRDITIAWYVAMLSRQEKVPSLQSLLSDKPTKAKSQGQTRDEQRRMLKHLSEYYRIPLREVTH
jgi:hypothetical protein